MIAFRHAALNANAKDTDINGLLAFARYAASGLVLVTEMIGHDDGGTANVRAIKAMVGQQLALLTSMPQVGYAGRSL